MTVSRIGSLNSVLLLSCHQSMFAWIGLRINCWLEFLLKRYCREIYTCLLHCTYLETNCRRMLHHCLKFWLLVHPSLHPSTLLLLHSYGLCSIFVCQVRFLSCFESSCLWIFHQYPIRHQFSSGITLRIGREVVWLHYWRVLLPGCELRGLSQVRLILFRSHDFMLHFLPTLSRVGSYSKL